MTDDAKPTPLEEARLSLSMVSILSETVQDPERALRWHAAGGIGPVQAVYERHAIACALVSIAESQAALLEIERERLERDRYMAEEYGELFPDRPIKDTPPL